ncbi:MAG: methyltransferase [Nitrosospira sp.]
MKLEPGFCVSSSFPAQSPDALSLQNTALLQLGHALKSWGYRFITGTPATHARVNSRRGNEWATNLEGVFGWSRPFLSSLLSSELFELMQEANVIASQANGWRSLVRVSSLKDDLLFHSAYPTTEADAVFFGPDSYRFITAIDSLIALTSLSVRRAIDVCCGAGPGAMAIASHFPQALVLASDINYCALRLTAINASLAGATNVQPCYSNLFHQIEGTFDLIVANPPYLVDPTQRAYRHGGGPLGSGLSFDIIDAALPRLSHGGTLLLYTGTAILNGIDRFRAGVERKLRNSDVHWHYTEIDPDVFGEELLQEAYAEADRIAAVIITVTRTR